MIKHTLGSCRTLGIWFLFLYSIFYPFAGICDTYYIAPYPEGKDSNNGTNDDPLATFSAAFSKMGEGDTLYVKDGLYHQQIKGMPSGIDADNYTKILAVNDHAAEIDGQETVPPAGSWEALLFIENKSFVEVRGLKVHHSGPDNDVLSIVGSNNIKVSVSGFWQASNDKYHKPVSISNSSDVLLEDVWAFGRGRYTVVLGAGATNCTLRRVVARWGEGAWSGEPIAGFSIYKAQENVLENCITLDHNPHPEWHGAGHMGFYNISWNNAMAESKNNRYLGCIAMALPNAQGFANQTSAQPDDDNNHYENCIAAQCSRGIGNYSSSRSTTIKNFSAIHNSGDGFFNSADAVATTFLNGLSVGNDNSGFWNNYGDLTASFLGAYGNGTSAFKGISPTNSHTVDPELKYPVRIEAGTHYKGRGHSGEDIGANVVKRYVNGVLTDVDLWPWPYENWIKEDMSTLSKRGFCADGKQLNGGDDITLTSYIWERLGNPIPPEIYEGATPETSPSVPTGLKVMPKN